MKWRHIAFLLTVLGFGIFVKQTGFAKGWFQKLKEKTEEKVIKSTQQAVETGVEKVKTGVEIATSAAERWKMDAWQLPNENLRYDQVAYLCSHNSFTYPPKWLYYQQAGDIKKQLDNGVRALMPDTHLYKNDIMLCHENCTGAIGAQHVGSNYQSFSTFLTTVRDWLNAHPSEIITIIIEEKSDDMARMAQSIERVSGLTNLILKPSDYDPLQHNGYWPTLRELKNMGKRLIIFTSRRGGKFAQYSYFQWKYMMESNYSTRDKNKICASERGESKSRAQFARRLLLINLFGAVASDEITASRNNSYDNLRALVNTCKSKGLGGGKNPNFIALDRVDKGNAMKLINELNKESAAQ